METYRLTQPRRLATAFAIFFLLAGSGIGVVGIASAQDPSDVPETMALPARHVGDAGSYEIWDGGSEPRRVDFAMLAAVNWKDAQGVSHPAEVLREEHHYDFGFAQVQFPREYHIGMADGQILASSPGGSSSSGSSTNPLLGSSERDETTSLRHTFGLDMIPCGMIHNAQGARVSTEAFESNCSVWGDGAQDFRAVGIESTNLGDALKFAATLRGETIELWYSSEIPYPIKVRTTREVGDDVDITERRLTSFQRGDAPAVAPEAVPTTPIPEVGWIGRDDRPFQADVLGNGYTWPMALQDALEDEDGSKLQAWLDGNPEWVLGGARTYQKMSNDYHLKAWTLELFGTHEIMIVYSYWFDAQAPAGLEALEPVYEQFDVRLAGARIDENFVPPPELPSAIVDPQTLEPVWRAYAETTDTPSVWGFTLPQCLRLGCVTATTQLGSVPVDSMAKEDSPMSLLDAQNRTFVSEGWTVQFEEDDFASVTRSVRVQQVNNTGTALPTQDESEGDEGAPALASTLGWNFPGSKAAAGATGVALLVSFLYWAWPAIKTMPVLGLFSRVRHSRLLEHQVRRQLMDAVEAEPGIHYQELVRRIGKGRGVIEHHLRKLQEAGMVLAHEGQGYRCFFPKGVGRHAMAAASAVKAPGAKAILEALTQAPGATSKQLSQTLGLAPATVHHHVTRLRQAGLIDAQKQGRGLALFPTVHASA